MFAIRLSMAHSKFLSGVRDFQRLPLRLRFDHQSRDESLDAHGLSLGFIHTLVFELISLHNLSYRAL